MEKSLSRSIGYIKPKGDLAKEVPKVKKEATPKKEEPTKNDLEPKSDDKNQSDAATSKDKNNGKLVVVWLSERDFINRSALCKAAKVDRANFDKYMKIGEFPEKIANPIVDQLKKYGYAE